MRAKTEAIVLSKIKYRDHDLIVKCYTRNRGVVSYLLRGVLKSKKQHSRIGYYQPLSQLEIEENYKPTHSLHYITDVKLKVPYQSMHTNVIKGAVVMFLSEVLASALREEESNIGLYEFLETTLQWLDQEPDFANFHLVFLLELTKHLGFYPDVVDRQYDHFDLALGTFEPYARPPYSVSGDILEHFKALMETKFDTLGSLKLNGRQRSDLLEVLLTYLSLHLVDFKKPKSSQIFHDVFN